MTLTTDEPGNPLRLIRVPVAAIAVGVWVAAIALTRLARVTMGEGSGPAPAIFVTVVAAASAASGQVDSMILMSTVLGSFTELILSRIFAKPVLNPRPTPERPEVSVPSPSGSHSARNSGIEPVKEPSTVVKYPLSEPVPASESISEPKSDIPVEPSPDTVDRWSLPLDSDTVRIIAPDNAARSNHGRTP